jgi:acetylornithine deacetylase/succinyl-diaminopimelate desuccinylase-like protein
LSIDQPSFRLAYAPRNIEAELRMTRWVPVVLCGVVAACTHAGAPPQIEADRLSQHIRVLADDAMEGRGAGYPGELRAAHYIAQQFSEAGLATPNGSYIAPFAYRPIGGTSAFQELVAHNVMGILPGASRPNEVVVLGAHYDGQGMVGQAEAGRFGASRAGDDRIWNSASDNATSIAALIEIARTLAHGPRPARTIVFVAFSAEENRLNGAFEYVRNPPLPWVEHIAMINMEKLVGHEDTQFLTATQGSSPRFDEFTAAAAERSGVDAVNFYAGIVTDTDHFAFNLAGLPALVIGTGAYERVHQHDDLFETLHLDALPARVQYVLEFTQALANDRATVPFSADLAGYTGVVGGAATQAELARCNLQAPAFVVSDIAPHSIAARSGVRVNDVIVSVNQHQIAFGEEGANFLEDATSERGDVLLQIACGAERREQRLQIAPQSSN